MRKHEDPCRAPRTTIKLYLRCQALFQRSADGLHVIRRLLERGNHASWRGGPSRTQKRGSGGSK